MESGDSLTWLGRSGSLPRHEADLPTQEAAAQPDARLPQADEDPGRAWGHQEAARQGAEATRPETAAEVAPGVRLGKEGRLRRRREFLEVQGRGRRIDAGVLLVLALDTGKGRPRIGITVSKKVGNAVERNRARRWIREAWRSVAVGFPALDLVVVARRAVLEAGFSGVVGALSSARRALVATGSAE